MTNPFKPIRPKKISEEIVGQIKELISKGQLKPGERVPSERDMASMLGVSRPSVRDAIMVLEAMGLIESRQGGGTFVRSLTETSLADPLTTMVEKDPRLLISLVEVRMGLETWSAFLAASKATEEELETLARLVEEMERQAGEGGWDPQVDAQFHYTITMATHNTIQLHILDTIRGLFQATIEVSLLEFYKREGYLESLLNQHRAIFEALRQRNPEKAREAMMEHLKFVQTKVPLIFKEKFS